MGWVNGLTGEGACYLSMGTQDQISRTHKKSNTATHAFHLEVPAPTATHAHMQDSHSFSTCHSILSC